MPSEESDVVKMAIMRRMGMTPAPSDFKGKVWIWYIAIVMVFVIYIMISVQLFLLILLLITLLYVPFVVALRYSPRARVEEESRVVVDEDIAHFRETVDKALKGRAVAQRDIELRILNALVVDMSIRYDLPEKEIRRNLGNEDFLRTYLGEKARLVADMYNRRHDLKKTLTRDEFVEEINSVLEAMR